jgi:hypothetical protein
MLLSLFLLQAFSGADPFAFFQPTIQVAPSDRSVLDKGSPLTRILPARGREDAVFTAIPVTIDGDRLIAWERRIEELKKGKYVLAVGRFSNPPRIEDLAGLELDRDDIEDIQKCRAGSCQLKLSSEEITQIRDAAGQAQGDATDATQEAFRQVVLHRVQLYLASGQVLPYNDEHIPVQPQKHFAALLQHTSFLTGKLPELSAYLLDYPSKPLPGVESFFYWSKEQAAGKAIISVTQVNIVDSRAADLPDLPDVLVVNRDIYSSHYINASLSVTALISGPADATSYLVYMNRTEVDILHGILEGFIRKVMHHRIRDEATAEIQTYKQRLESGDPPPEKLSSEHQE